MFSHASVPLTLLLIIMLLGVIAAFLHPVHALTSWLRKRRKGSSSQAVKKVGSR